MVDPIVRRYRLFPSVQIFIFARTNELQNSPAQKARSEATTIRHVEPNTVSYAAWCGQVGAGGKATTTVAMNDAKASAANPDHTTFLARAYPYTSVNTSPKMYETGKNRTPAPNVNGPIFATFPGPMRLAQRRTVTNAAMTRS